MVTAVPFQRVDATATQPFPAASARCAPAESNAENVLLLAKAGDQTAFATLVRRYQNMVFSIALHMLRSRPAASDSMVPMRRSFNATPR